MIFLIAIGFVGLLMVFATGVVEAWARHRHWTGYDERPVRYEPRWPGRPW